MSNERLVDLERQVEILRVKCIVQQNQFEERIKAMEKALAVEQVERRSGDCVNSASILRLEAQFSNLFSSRAP